LFHLYFCFPGYYDQYQDPRLIPQPPQGYYYPRQNYNPYPSSYAPEGGGYEYPPQADYDFIQTDENEMATSTGSTNNAATSSAAAVQTPPETQGATATGMSSNANMDALDIQLAAALEAVKADMISKGKQVLEEKQWTDDVKSVIEQYQHKISNVYNNIETLKADMLQLYKKKQMILNAQLQKELTQKLADSKSDLTTVTAALEKVTNTEAEFEQSKEDIQKTIDSINTQLAELKGTTGGAGATAGASSQTGQSSQSSQSSDSSDPSEQDIVDKKAEISSKIDTIKSIVDALNK